MKIDFAFTLFNLDGSEMLLPDKSVAVANQILANWIMNTATTKPADITKMYNWAMELYKTGFIDLDAAGRKEFQTFIENIENVSVMVKGLLLERLNRE